jgi:hypothetical protein
MQTQILGIGLGSKKDFKGRPYEETGVKSFIIR